MVNLSSKKFQTAIRFWPEELKLLKNKLTIDGITLQKLSEILFKAYINNNEEIMKLVNKHANDKNNKKKRYAITELETEDIYAYVEKQSPINNVNNIIKELEDKNNK